MAEQSEKRIITANSYFPALTGVRAVGAYMVFIYHIVISDQASFLSGKSSGIEWLARLGLEGHIGVTIFFVLSGFLITARYINGLSFTKSWFRRYLQNRFARIYPVYLILTVFAFTIMTYKYSNNWYEWGAAFTPFDKVVTIILNLTLTRAYFYDIAFIGIPTAWTLTVEETFYLSAPFLLLGLRFNTRALYLYPLILLIIGLALAGFCTRYLPYYGLMNSIGLMLGMTFFGRCIEFLMGMRLALWMNRRAEDKHKNPVTHATAFGVAGIIIGALLLAVIQYFIEKDTPASLYMIFIVNNILLPIPIVLLFWGLIRERTWLQSILQSRLFILLGKSSYIFYLIHLGAVDFLFTHNVSDHWLVRLVAYTLLSITLYHLVEKPMQKLLRAKPVEIKKQTSTAVV
ncbi:acyltransferase family protein [Hymenobacter sp. HDW8]|uniref:acyltransferase family protein n=1 Tax=Hymenobacter sp. HDW8 TaxID=2714932 RepID=UPI001409A5F9|nr:acyltransferase [Hymenobacter sp. HDW8]QIL77850.1 acyltransferase [Hymenobacter sp. HDW8]